MPAAGQRHFARMARHSRNFPATRSKRESKMRTHRSSLGALVASTGLLGLLAGLSTCAEDPPKSKTQSLPAPPGAPDDTAARALLAATPLGSVVLRDTRGTGRFVVGTVGADLPPLDLSAESAARLHL